MAALSALLHVDKHIRAALRAGGFRPCSKLSGHRHAGAAAAGDSQAGRFGLTPDAWMETHRGHRALWSKCYDRSPLAEVALWALPHPAARLLIPVSNVRCGDPCCLASGQRPMEKRCGVYGGHLAVKVANVLEAVLQRNSVVDGALRIAGDGHSLAGRRTMGLDLRSAAALARWMPAHPEWGATTTHSGCGKAPRERKPPRMRPLACPRAGPLQASFGEVCPQPR